MAQQLDLFGAFMPEPKPPQKEVLVKNTVLPEYAKIVETELIVENTTEEPIIETSIVQPQESLLITEEALQQNNEIATIELQNEKHITQVPFFETVYDAVKRKRGRPRKEKPLIVIPKIKLKRGRKSFTETYVDVDLSGVPTDEELNKKLYYSISEVAKWFNVTNSQIRFWENEFDILQPKKNKKGDRLFRPEDIKNLKIIYFLLRQKKLSIQGAKDHLKANLHKSEGQQQLQQSLQNFKSFLLELKAGL